MMAYQLPDDKSIARRQKVVRLAAKFPGLFCNRVFSIIARSQTDKVIKSIVSKYCDNCENRMVHKFIGCIGNEYEFKEMK